MNLATILRPCSVPVFLTDYFGRASLHVSGSEGRFNSLVTGSVLEMLGTQELLDRTDRVYDPIEIAAHNIERELEARVHANLTAPSGTVPLQRLGRDLIVLQIFGQTECVVQAENAEQVGEPARIRMGNGDVLYVPSGWSFAVMPVDQPVQLRFEIENPTGADLLEWVGANAKRDPLFQKSIPRFADPATRADYVRDLRRVLARIVRDPRVLERFRRETNLKCPPRPVVRAIPWFDGAPLNYEIEILTPRRIRLKRADPETLLLVAIRKRVAFPQDAAPLLHYICDQAPVSIGRFFEEFEKEFDREELSDLLAVLSKEGIIGLRDPHSN